MDVTSYFESMSVISRQVRLFVVGGFLIHALGATAQDPTTQFQIFGHVTGSLEQENSERHSDFSLGEHDFFVQSKITPRISFLSETVVAPLNVVGHGMADFKVSIERARLKFQHREWFSVIIGKMHSPVNYWNDVYHHGRLFFPTIDRPRSFGSVIPIHTLGLRLQGQNIGALNFGYDLVIGNGMSSNDVSDGSLQKSLTAAVHIKPEERMRIGISAYRDRVAGNSVGAHSGHSSTFHYSMGSPNWYPVDLDYELYCFSLWRKTSKWETLLETSWNRSGISASNDPELVAGLDSLGTSNNFTFFLFAGRTIGKKKRDQIYGLLDMTDFEERDLHIKSNQLTKFGFGWAREFSPLVNIRTQVERYTGVEGFEIPKDDKWELKVRIAYCLY